MVLLTTIVLLVGSNIFMTLAWYGHLRYLEHRPWFLAVLVAWSVALLEYTLQVPANRIGSGRLSLPQLKILQEAITLVVFLPVVGRLFEIRWRWDFLWAGVCLLGAVYFAFRGGLEAS
jgi:uncharacterized protein (DUF486 family)